MPKWARTWLLWIYGIKLAALTAYVCVLIFI